MMPTIYDLKPRFQQLLRPLTAALHRLGITANAVTLVAALTSIFYAIWMLMSSGSRLPFLLLPVFMLARMALNAIDGMLARQYQQQSKLGAILNEAGDVISDVALFYPFALFSGVQPGIAIGVAFLMMLTEFIGLLGLVIGGGRRYDGPMGKSDRAFVFGLLGLLLGTHCRIDVYLNSIFVALMFMLVWTVWNRGRRALANVI